MTGLYPGLDGFLPNILTETVNTCLDFMIEAVKNKGVTFVVYILHIHTHTLKQNTNTHTHKRMYKLRLINMEVKFAKEYGTYCFTSDRTLIEA